VKFVYSADGRFLFRLDEREKNLFLDLLQRYPVIDKPYQPLSKSLAPDEADQELLEDALRSHQREVKQALLAAFGGPESLQKTRAGYRLSLAREQLESLLQVLNDIRVGTWRLMGCPDEDAYDAAPADAQTAVQRWVLDITAWYQHTIISAIDGNSLPEHYPVRLGRRKCFPSPINAPASGLVAVGGDLTPERLLLAYRTGIFPWSVNPITWWSPHPRGIIELDGFRVSRSLTKTLRRAPFEITYNRAFKKVITACAKSPGRDETWISPQFITAYARLHRMGHAHSVECWQAGKLVGGVYGVAIGAAFAAESMFHSVSNASKVALYHLVHHLGDRGFRLLDIQAITPITQQLGAVQIPRTLYLQRLYEAVDIPARFV
jgi:leucyl/phenylalanyl-tRNA--protein transferase